MVVRTAQKIILGIYFDIEDYFFVLFYRKSRGAIQYRFLSVR